MTSPTQMSLTGIVFKDVKFRGNNSKKVMTREPSLNKISQLKSPKIQKVGFMS